MEQENLLRRLSAIHHSAGEAPLSVLLKTMDEYDACEMSLSVGFLVDLRYQLVGVVMGKEMSLPTVEDELCLYFYCLVYSFCSESQRLTLLRIWTPKTLFGSVTNFSRKSLNMAHETKQSLFRREIYNELPEHFEDVDISILVGGQLWQVESDIGLSYESLPAALQFRYPLQLGLLVKLRTVLIRVIRRNSKLNLRMEQLPELLRKCCEFFSTDKSGLDCFHAEVLLEIAIEISQKALNLSSKLQKRLMSMPLEIVDLAPTSSSSLSASFNFNFDSEFLRDVAAYHSQIARPEGTFSLCIEKQLQELAVLDRDICPGCSRSQQIYCGSCSGIRMPNAELSLPRRVDLPFDVLIILHWHETLHKCTGIHAAVLAAEGTVSVQHWRKDVSDGDWREIARDLDSHNDVMLFPGDGASPVEEFDWEREEDSAQSQLELAVENFGIVENDQSHDGSQSSLRSLFQSSSSKKKWRLVVLEATWNHGKSMFKRICQLRAEENLEPIHCVSLNGIVGQYWRFHNEGNAAVSSIEAIAYTAQAAATSIDRNKTKSILRSDEDVTDDSPSDHKDTEVASTSESFSSPSAQSVLESLLFLFYLQKYRVLKRIGDGGRPPKAIQVTGTGSGSWDRQEVSYS